MSEPSHTPQEIATQAIAEHGLFIEHVLNTLGRQCATATDADQQATYNARRDRIDRMTAALETLSAPIMAKKDQNIPQDLADGLMGLSEISRVQRDFITDDYSAEKVQQHLQGLAAQVQQAAQFPSRQTGQTEVGG